MQDPNLSYPQPQYQQPVYDPNVQQYPPQQQQQQQQVYDPNQQNPQYYPQQQPQPMYQQPQPIYQPGPQQTQGTVIVTSGGTGTVNDGKDQEMLALIFFVLGFFLPILWLVSIIFCASPSKNAKKLATASIIMFFVCTCIQICTIICSVGIPLIIYGILAGVAIGVR